MMPDTLRQPGLASGTASHRLNCDVRTGHHRRKGRTVARDRADHPHAKKTVTLPHAPRSGSRPIYLEHPAESRFPFTPMSTKPKTTKPQRRAAGAIKTLAVSLGLTPRRCQQLISAGMPSDPTQAQAWRAARENDDSAAALRRERIKLVKAQRERAELENQRTRGDVIDRAEVELEFTGVGLACSAFIKSLEVELPQLCLGLGLDRSRPLVRSKIREMQTILADRESYFWKTHPATTDKRAPVS